MWARVFVYVGGTAAIAVFAWGCWQRVSVWLKGRPERRTDRIPERLAIEERILVSEVKEVEVKLVAKDTRPAPSSVSKEGILRFELAVPPHEQQKVEFAYEISAAANVAGL